MAMKQLGNAPSLASDTATKSYVDSLVLLSPQNMTLIATKTENYSANIQEIVPCDVSGASIAVTLPLAPADNSRIVVKKVDESANTITVTCQGTDKIDSVTGPSTYLIEVEGETVTVHYRAGIWYVIEHSLPDAATKNYVDAAKNSFAANVGNGSSTSIAVTHNLGTLDVVVSVHLVSTGEEVDCDIVKTSGNVVTLNFATAPALNSLRCTVIGTAFGTGSPIPVASTGITDATSTGRALITAANAAAAQSAIDIPGAISTRRSVADVRDWSGVREWKASLGAACTAGQTTLSNSVIALTSNDVGSTVILSGGNGAVSGSFFGVGSSFWMTTIVSVNNGVAEIADAAPTTQTNARMQWGPDVTAPFNAALSAVGASSDSRREVYIPGRYMLSQLMIPGGVRVRGTGWGSNYGGYAWWEGMGSFLAQIPGSECDFVVFANSLPQTTDYAGPGGLSDILLRGPQRNVMGHSVTTGNGVAVYRAQDGFFLDRVHVTGFPENGFLFKNGMIPGYMTDCRAFYNNGYGIDYVALTGESTDAPHFLNYSADGNTLGAMRLKGLNSKHSPVIITAMKSESSNERQLSAVVLEDCDNAPIIINGLCHYWGRLSIGSTTFAGEIVSEYRAAGPAILLTKNTTTNKRARVVFNSVTTRIIGDETGTTSDAVPLRDSVGASNVDIPATVTSGHYPPDALEINVADTNFIISDNTDPTKKVKFEVSGVSTGQTRTLTLPDSNTTIVGTEPTQNLNNKTLNLPKINSVLDTTNGQTALAFWSPASTVNYLQVQGNATGGSPGLMALGTDTNISPSISPKGSGSLQIYMLATGNAARIVANGVDADVNLNLQSKGTNGKVQVNGAEASRRTIQTITTSTTLGTNGDYIAFVDSGGAPILPTAVGNTGRYTVKNIDSSDKTISTTSSQTIDGSTTLTLPAFSSAEIVSDGSNWRII